MQQAGQDGKVQAVKTLGKAQQGARPVADPDGPAGLTQDKLWGWFNDIRDKGILLSDRTNNRKSGSIVMYDSTNVEIARFNFTNGWPSQDLHRSTVCRVQRPGEGDDHPDDGEPGAGQVKLTTQYEFTLPRGYVDREGEVHRKGLMRLATARDELEPLRDPTVQGPDDPRLTVLILARVVQTARRPDHGHAARDRGTVRGGPGLPAGLLRSDQLRQPAGIRGTPCRTGGVGTADRRAGTRHPADRRCARHADAGARGDG